MAKKKAVEVDTRFPRDLYKKGGECILRSAGEEYEYSKVHVEDQDDFDQAVEAGYADDFACIMADEEDQVEDQDLEKEDF